MFESTYSASFAWRRARISGPISRLDASVATTSEMRHGLTWNAPCSTRVALANSDMSRKPGSLTAAGAAAPDALARACSFCHMKCCATTYSSGSRLSPLRTSETQSTSAPASSASRSRSFASASLHSRYTTAP